MVNENDWNVCHVVFACIMTPCNLIVGTVISK